MSDEKKRVADALAALASGQHDDDQARDAEHAEPIEAGEPIESAAEAAAPAPPPRPVPAPRPASPQRPSSPVATTSGRTFVADASVKVPGTPLRRKSAPKSVFATLAFKRALIPVCLVLGVGMPLLTALWFTLDQDHPARKIGVLFPLVFLFMGLGVLTLGILLMFQVQDELRHGEGSSRRV